MRKKNIAYPIFTANHRFFTPVNANGGNIKTSGAPAITFFTIQPVSMAFAGT